MNAIEISHLKKYYGDVKAVDDVSFSVAEGEFFAFLGVNGAGKSTTIAVLCGKEPRTDGEVRIEGVGIDERKGAQRARLGIVFQSSVLDGALSVRDNLEYRAALYGIRGKAFRQRLEELCARFDLAPLLKRAAGKLSGGERRRADIARALVHEPRILILDEPTTGLDPQTRQTFWQAVHALRRERGLTVFLTTHYMEEAADADRVVILDAGKVRANATPHELKNAYTGDFITLYGVREEELTRRGLGFERAGEGLRIAVKSTAEATRLVLSYPELFADYEITKGKMDDVFLAVTGKRIGEEL